MKNNYIYGTEINQNNMYDLNYEKTPFYQENNDDNTRYNDLFFASIFISQIILTFAIGIYNMTSHQDISFQSSNNYGSYLFFSSILSIILSYFVLSMIKKYPDTFIIGANTSIIILNFIFALTCFIKQSILGGALFLTQALFSALWFYFSMHYVNFSKILLNTSIKILDKNKNLLLVPIGTIFIGMAYFPFFIFTFNYYFKLYSDNNSVGKIGMSLCIMCFFWTQQVLTNIIHTTVAGVVGCWYFGHNQFYNNNVFRSFKISLTKNFGSICFGSLIVALVKSIHLSVHMIRQSGDNDFIMCCADCILQFLENIIEYFNEYAYSYIGIYNMSYINAANSTWNLVKRSGLIALFNDNLIYPVLLFSTLFITIGTGFFFWLMTNDVILSVMCGFIAFIISSVIMNLIHSIIVSLFVCCTENMTILDIVDPDLNNAISMNRNPNEYNI
jgi:hypothetical protein